MAKLQNAGSFGSAHKKSLEVKVVVVVLIMGLGLYIVGPSLYWELTDYSIAAAQRSATCAPCLCDCPPLQNSANPIPGCIELNSALQDSDQIRLEEIHEELELKESIAEERKLTSSNEYMGIKKLTSQYQKEAEKCTVGMQTSEEAREKAEALLTLEVQRAKDWEYRARQLGWQEIDEKTK